MCYQGICRKQSELNITHSCFPNPCMNGGICVVNNSDLNHICDCPDGYSGIF
jgi:hypothetical protein